jgi:F-type H+-transporting ATPase subunit delta
MAQTAGASIAARRYAEAAYAIARDHGTQDQWRDDIASIAELLRHPQAAAYLDDAKVRDEDKARLLERALDISPLGMNLAKLLLQRGRLALAPAILAEYDRMLDAERGIARAHVTTAVPLGPAEERAVAERLRQLVGAREVRLETEVDPALIGGMVARIGDRLIDGSVRTRLQELKRSLAGAAR